MKTPPTSPSPFSTHSRDSQSLKRNAEDDEIKVKRQKTIPQPKIIPKGAYTKAHPLNQQRISVLPPVKSTPKEDCPVTPQNAKIRQGIPATPGWNLKQKNINNKEFFDGSRLPIETDPHPLDMGIDISTNNIYKENGIARNVFKQPEGSKSCWAYCLAMLASDLLRENRNEMQLGALQEWMDNSYLLNAEKVKSFASSIGVELEHTKIPLKDSLDHLKNQLVSTGHPVLVSIEHSKIQGHAIVIDHISDTETTLRDPFTGRAWKTSNVEMIRNLINDGIEQSCLSLATESN